MKVLKAGGLPSETFDRSLKFFEHRTEEGAAKIPEEKGSQSSRKRRINATASAMETNIVQA